MSLSHFPAAPKKITTDSQADTDVKRFAETKAEVKTIISRCNNTMFARHVHSTHVIDRTIEGLIKTAKNAD